MLQEPVTRLPIQVAEPLGDEEVCFSFVERAAGNRQVVEQFLGSTSALAFGNVGGDRDDCSADLTRQLVTLVTRPSPRDSIRLLHQVHRLLPGYQVSVTLESHRPLSHNPSSANDRR